MTDVLSPLQTYRLHYQPKLPRLLQDVTALAPIREIQDFTPSPFLSELFAYTRQQPFLAFEKREKTPSAPIIVGVVLSGGQAPGGHNVIAGLFDALKKWHPHSRLIGFLDGPSGIVKNKSIEITQDLLARYRNQGGFDIIGSGRTKIETKEQFLAAEETAKALDLDGLVVIGGDDSNTNAAFMAEHFAKAGLKTRVVGVPKTIDGDLKNEYIQISFGFDTACKTYSEIIGNILKDALSAKKYYYFIKLMGRSASHITLECALQTHPNMALISEEIEAEAHSLTYIVNQIADMICLRAEKGKNYGAILIPEGIIEFIPEFKRMIQDLNHLLASDQIHVKKMESLHERDAKIQYMTDQLQEDSRACFISLPADIQEQLMLDRDPHGNVQVSKIETERLLISLVEKELDRRKQQGLYKGKFAAQPLFCGYEGRSGLPSNFDSQYCYALGFVAALLIETGATGYLACVRHLTQPVEEWTILGIPIFNLLHLEIREGKKKAVIRKALVDLQGKPFSYFQSQRKQWMEKDDYLCPGPIQFEGPAELTESCPLILKKE